MARPTDLNEPASPEGIPQVLRNAADMMREQAGDLQSAWQDKNAGGDWNMIARELERAADRIQQML